jgi:hypothetical protein
MLAWCWLVALDRTTGWKRNLATVALTLIVFSAVTSGFRSGEFIDYNWKFYSESIGKKDLVIPINPKGWQITVESKK